MGLGIIARDNLEKNVQVWAVARERAINPMVVEIDAVRVAILLAQQNGWNQVEIQLDIKALVECLQAQVSLEQEALKI